MLKWFSKNELLKLSGLNSVAIFFKMATGLFINKLLAVCLAPYGIAFVGNFRDFSQFILGISTLSIEKGVVRYSSEYKNSRSQLSAFISSLFFLFIPISILVAFLVFGFAPRLSLLLFESLNYTIQLRVFSVAVPFMVAHSFLLSIINGIEKYKAVVWIGVISNFLYTILMLVLVAWFGLSGALYGIALTPMVLFFTTLFMLKKDWTLLIGISKEKARWLHLNNLCYYALMVAFSAIAFPLLNLFIRNFIIETLGSNKAGYWEAMHRLSIQYMIFIQSLATLYLLPKYAQEKIKNGFVKWAIQFYKMIFPFFMMGLLLLYLLKKYLVILLFSEEFLPMLPLFKWQLLGDVFKAAAWVITFQFFAKRIVLPYILIDLLLVVLLPLLLLFFTKEYGLEGVVMAHFTGYLVYFLVLIMYFNKPFVEYFKFLKLND